MIVLQLGEEVFSVHPHLLCRASGVFQSMLEPGPVSHFAHSPDGYLPEGTNSSCPLPLDPHGTQAEWNAFFDFIYPPQ
jgi:hypothetical protein